MNNDNVQIDSSQVDKLLDTLADDNVIRDIMFKAVKAGGETLRKNTLQNLRSSSFDSSSMEKGVRVKGDKNYLEAIVSIMGDYRLRWFEKGTAARYTKGAKITGIDENSTRYALKRTGKPRYTGSIKPHYFFRNARDNESAITEAITQSIDNALKNLGIQ